MPKHITRLLLLMVILGAVGYGAKGFFTVDSFYEYGHYRGKSVAEIASDKPKYKGMVFCASCHTQQLVEWSQGAHNKPDIGKIVKCEVCHGPAGERDVRGMFEHLATGVDHPKNLKLVVPADTRQLCTLCHERLTGRPLQQPQIVVADHAGTQQCTVCHNPHSPKLNLVSTAPAAQRGDAVVGKIKAAACAGCHSAEDRRENLIGPSLAGQKTAYLVEALKAYATGARDNPMMTAAAQVSDADAADLAAYYAGLKCESTLIAERQAPAPRAAASSCIACHGANGTSGNPAWPNLVGLSKDYLVAAMKAYKDGSRKNAMMAGIAKGLSDAETENVAAYYANATCK